VATVTLREIVARLGGELLGNGETVVDRIASIENASSGSITFLSNPKYHSALAQTCASAVILSPSSAADVLVPAIVTAQPYLYFARVAQWLHPAPSPTLGIHPSATVASPLHRSVSVGSGSRIGMNSKIANNVVIGAGCTIGDNVEIGAGSLLHAGVTIYANTRIGSHAIIHSGAVIGADGFGFAREQNGSWVKIPQSGRVLIGDDVEIGANTCIDRGAIEDTVIGNGVKLDNLIQIAHNVHIGEHTAIAACVGIAGSTTIGKRCTIAGASSIIGHLQIADDVNILVASLISRSIPKAGTYSGSVPFLKHEDWLRNFSHLRHLDRMADKIRDLEKRLAELESAK
jgi:UDP-3-O-[3-hydroxymyristoyl] glucosamine N-acyltransferase